MKPTLMILAAGVGSRYGGLKQLDPMGPSGEVIMDYSIYDAIRAGFEKVVFVIRHDFEEQFREKIGSKYADKIQVSYAFQELDDIPEEFSIPDGRTKPWGTGHAILVAKDVVNEPFAMINADDFYGFDSFDKVSRQLQNTDVNSDDWCMSGYKLKNVLSAHGGVTRAMCELDPEGYLTHIVELFEIARDGDKASGENKQNEKFPLELDALTSMNFFGFTPTLFDKLQKGFASFLRREGGEMKSEYLIPTIVNDLIAAGECRMKVLSSEDSWFGVTYTEDKPRVQESIRKLVESGAYPSPLF
jgi:dTDP-glucose pyrophosphorylase